MNLNKFDYSDNYLERDAEKTKITLFPGFKVAVMDVTKETSKITFFTGDVVVLDNQQIIEWDDTDFEDTNIEELIEWGNFIEMLEGHTEFLFNSWLKRMHSLTTFKILSNDKFEVSLQFGPEKRDLNKYLYEVERISNRFWKLTNYDIFGYERYTRLVCMPQISQMLADSPIDMREDKNKIPVELLVELLIMTFGNNEPTKYTEMFRYENKFNITTQNLRGMQSVKYDPNKITRFSSLNEAKNKSHTAAKIINYASSKEITDLIIFDDYETLAKYQVIEKLGSEKENELLNKLVPVIDYYKLGKIICQLDQEHFYVLDNKIVQITE